MKNPKADVSVESSFRQKGAPSKLRLGGPVSSQTKKAVITDKEASQEYVVTMPWGLRRYQETGQLHFLTFSCYKRRPNFANIPSRTTFETSLEQVRQYYALCVYGYVVMPEHIHMLVNEPEQGSLSRVMQSLKQSVARTLALRAADPFWQARSYDFNVWSEHKFVEKLRYIHRNPVMRGLLERPEDWVWSSFRHYPSGVVGRVELESQWTARRREQAGIFPLVRKHPAA